MKKLLLIVIFLIALLTGCTTLYEGNVISKKFTPQHVSTYFVAMRMGNSTFLQPRHQSHPDYWEVCVELEGKNDCWSVSEKFYDSVEVGDYIFRLGKESK